MTEALLRKRDRELDALPESIDVQERKRFHGEETEQFFHLLQLHQSLAEDAEEDEFCPSEEVVNRVMRSLEEEIATTCSTSSAATDISGDHEGLTLHTDSGVDLCYLLEASDDDLGIPWSPVWDTPEEFCRSLKETHEGLKGNPNLKSLYENCYFVDEFENYHLFEFYDHAWDATHIEDNLNIDFVSEDMLFDGEMFSAA